MSKTCPITPTRRPGFDSECREEECAWWDEVSSECAVLLAALVLRDGVPLQDSPPWRAGKEAM